MSTVYLGEQRGHGGFARTVAVKTLHPHLAAHPEVAQLFIGEARLGGHLVHPNVVQTLDFGEESGQLFLAMEYIHGLTLAQVVSAFRSNRRYVPQDIVLDVMIRVAQGLGYAHKARDSRGTALNMVHRDLKPSNILLGRHGEVKVCDFGVARSTSSVLHTQASGMLRGTCRYMSPEQAWGRRDLDRRSDLFALGLVFFESLALEPMYHQRQNEAVLRFAQDANVEERLERLPRTPIRGELMGILRRALAKEKEERYQWAEEMVADLTRVRGMLPNNRTLGGWMTEALAIAGAPAQLEPSPYALPQLGDDPEDDDDDLEATPTVRLVPPKIDKAIFQDDQQAAQEMGSQPQTMSVRPLPGAEAQATPSPGSSKKGLVLVVALGVALGAAAGAYWMFGGTRAPEPPPSLVVKEPVVTLARAPIPETDHFGGAGEPGGAGDSAPGALSPKGEGGSDPEIAPGEPDAGAQPEAEGPPPAQAGGTTKKASKVSPAPPKAAPAKAPSTTAKKTTSTQKAQASKAKAASTPPPKVSPAAAAQGTAVASLSQCDNAPVGAGALLLNARPPASVTIDGRSLGRSPVCAPSVSPGSHTLSFVVDGQPPMTHTITAKPGVVARCTAFFSKYAVSCRED